MDTKWNYCRGCFLFVDVCEVEVQRGTSSQCSYKASALAADFQ
jgi:hypothetical protein